MCTTDYNELLSAPAVIKYFRLCLSKLGYSKISRPGQFISKSFKRDGQKRSRLVLMIFDESQKTGKASKGQRNSDVVPVLLKHSDLSRLTGLMLITVW